MSKSLNGITALLLLLAGVSCGRPGNARFASHAAPGKEAVASQSVADTTRWPVRFGLGRPATAAEIGRLDHDVRPDGTGLPAGSGTVAAGKAVYAAKCAACHGITGVEGPHSRLVARADHAKEKTVGNYWPYATTLFDYIRRAMPYNAPGSLTDEEVYGVTAFLLRANGLIDSTAVLDARTLPAVAMPARPRFVPDDRRGGPEVR
ncbi:MAG: cytochrome c [Cytophagales bacterium]|nr:cytochrome c [Cytophagales bacterium]